MRSLKISKTITDRKSDSLEKYLHEIGKEELITPEEEIELSKKIKNEDFTALEKLVKSNLRFVVSVAKQYQNRGLALADLIMEGNIGLIEAARRYDGSKGFKFISYAVWWIRSYIIQAITTHSKIIRLPSNQLQTLSKLNEIINRFQHEHDRQPSEDELEDLVGIPASKIRELLSADFNACSLDAPVKEESGFSLIDVLPHDDSSLAEKQLMDESLKIELERLLSVLNDREKKIIQLFFGLGGEELTLPEISELIGLTKIRVRQLKDRALWHLKRVTRNKKLIRVLESN